jgi:hypothetical protein
MCKKIVTEAGSFTHILKDQRSNSQTITLITHAGRSRVVTGGGSSIYGFMESRVKERVKPCGSIKYPWDMREWFTLKTQS